LCDLNQDIGQCDIEKIGEDGDDSDSKGILRCISFSGEVRIKIIGCQISKDGYVKKDEEDHVGSQKRIFVCLVRLIGIKNSQSPDDQCGDIDENSRVSHLFIVCRKSFGKCVLSDNKTSTQIMLALFYQI